MRSGDKATKTGKLFYDTLKVKTFDCNLDLITLKIMIKNLVKNKSIFRVISLRWPQIDW